MVAVCACLCAGARACARVGAWRAYIRVKYLNFARNRKEKLPKALGVLPYSERPITITTRKNLLASLFL